MFFGAIADDYTGATDLAGTLVNAGLRVVQTFGPGGAVDPESVDAVVVALKSRSTPAGEAVGQSLEALEYLKRLGADRYFFKYCSTFDSTPDGNIGPVAAALADAIGNKKTLFVPSFPENGRTVCHGHLFVDGVLLNESGMERHPLNPMTDANLVRVLAAQSDRAVGLVPRTAFGGGCGDVRRVIDEAAEPFLVVDALDNKDLMIVAEAVPDLALATGGSAFAGYLAKSYWIRKTPEPAWPPPTPPDVPGRTVLLAGSCSPATRRQIAQWRVSGRSARLDLIAASEDFDGTVAAAVDEAAAAGSDPVLFYTTADEGDLTSAREALGPERAAAVGERLIAELAARLVASGVRRLVVAGGETSGAVVNRLGIAAIRIGPEIAPGVPWCESLPTGETPPLALALKSGNFGGPDFFADALGMLP